MYERSSSLVLRWLKVPPEPQPPHGDPASLRVFRAGKNLFNLRLFTWGVSQLAALAGIIFWLVVFLEVESAIKERQTSAVAPTSAKDFKEYLEKIGGDEKPTAPAAPAPAQATAVPAAPAATTAASTTPAANAATAGTEVKPGNATPGEPAKKKRTRARINGFAGFKAMLVQIGLRLPPWSFPVIWALKIAGFVAYLVQIPITYTVRRLDYELRWYMVTDRSLRIRHGVWKISESTMSFANIQQVVVTQGPVQRFLGLADVKVQSAGGGGGISPEAHQHGGEDMHLGLFHSVNNAPEIRDLILERLKRFRESGLGDPDEKLATTPSPATAAPASPGEALSAARELLAEAKALRAAL